MVSENDMISMLQQVEGTAVSVAAVRGSAPACCGGWRYLGLALQQQLGGVGGLRSRNIGGGRTGRQCSSVRGRGGVCEGLSCANPGARTPPTPRTIIYLGDKGGKFKNCPRVH